MRRATAGLSAAIRNGDVDFVRRTLVSGSPRNNCIDVNELPSEGYNHSFHPIIHAIYHCASETALFEIIMHILAYRDSTGNPVINLNATTSNDHSMLELILERFLRNRTLIHLEIFTQAHVRQLVDTVINCRDNLGNQLFTNYTGGYTSILSVAVMTQDTEIVRSLLDLRNHDGTFAINPNAVMHPWEKTALDVAIIGSYISNTPDTNYHPNPNIIRLLEERGARRLVNLLRVERAPPPTPIQPIPGPLAVAQTQRFDQNPQNTHTPEVERTVDLSILQLKKTYEFTKKPNFADVQGDITTLINAQVGGRLYTAEQISHIRIGFSYVCNNPDSLHAQSNLRLSEIMTLVWLGIHDESKMPEDFPLSGDKDLFVKTRRAALLDKFLAIATTYPEGRRTSCLGGTRNLIVSTLNKAHPDVSIAPTSGAVKELGLEHAKRFMLDELKRLPIIEQRAVLRTWNEPDGDGEKGKTPVTKFKERVKPLLIAELTRTLGTILPSNFFTELDEQYEYFPEPVVHRKLADLCKKIRELPDDLFDGVATLQSTITNAFIFADKEGSFDDEYQQLKSRNVLILALRLFENKSKLDQLIADVEKYTKNKSESYFSKNDIKSEGAMALLGLLRTLKTLDPTRISSVLDTIEKTLVNDEKKYFGLKFNTWFFTKERESKLRGYYERAKTLISDIVGDQRVRSISVTFT